MPQYMSEAEIAPYIVNNFAELKISSSGSGFCVDDVLKALNLPVFGRPNISIA